MLNIFSSYTLCAGLTLFFTVLLFAKFRLPALVRFYALSSLALAGIAFALSVEGDEHAWIIGLVTIIVKVLLIPFLILFAARKSKASLRLQSFLRPAPSYFLAACILLLTLFITFDSPFVFGKSIGILFFVSISLVMLGITMMIVRRDLYSQIIGFLVLENGLALFGIVTVGSIPILIELGIFLVITTSVFIMSSLSSNVQELYGSGDTEKLRELTD